MKLEEIESIFMSKQGATKEFPFGDDTMVFKVMNKKHWNTITLDGTMNEEILKEMVDDSYSLVVSKLTKKQKEELKLHNNKQEIS
ncbi:MAG: MmcQ/YjbR family DNA-binding protein [Candidatus Paceibacteria bacterium]